MRDWLVIISSLFIALLLNLLPWTLFSQWLWPNWLLLVLIYWAMVQSIHVGVGIAWFLGLGMDTFGGTLLGEHALAYTLVIYCVIRMRMRLCQYGLWQQMISIFILLSGYRFVLYCIQGLIGEWPISLLYWLTVITSVAMWPIVIHLLRFYQKFLID